MNLKKIALLRIHNQYVSAPAIEDPGRLVSYMGAMQAQDYLMAKWAVGIRMPGIKEAAVQAALDKGEIIRTHAMRPTWHLVAPEDVYWLLALTAPQVRRHTKSMHTRLELTDAVITRAMHIITTCLDKEKHATRETLLLALEKEKIATSENRAAHILIEAELQQLICNGPLQGAKQTYALLSERVKHKKILAKDEAQATLAKKYFISHGPATLKDFVWWSGMSVTDARAALANVKKELQSADVAGHTYWFSAEGMPPAGRKKQLYLIPGYDELLISYANRNAMLLEVHNKRVISSNGIFRPLIMIDGEVAGLWKTVRTPGSIGVETEFFNPPGPEIEKQLAEKICDFAAFTGKKLREG